LRALAWHAVVLQDEAFHGVVRDALLQCARDGDLAEVVHGDNGEILGSTWNVYYAMVLELLYAFRDGPEKADGEYDEVWTRAALQRADYAVDEDEETSEELEQAYEDAVEMYADAEATILSQLLVDNREQAADFDIGWVRRVLGYTTPDPLDDHAVGVWRRTWATAKLCADEFVRENRLGADAHGGAAGAAAAGDSVGAGAGAAGASGGGGAAAAAADDTSDGDGGSSMARRKASSQLGFDFDAIVTSNLQDISDGLDPITASEQALGAGLVEAAGARGDNAVKQALKSALQRREAEAEAEGKVHAALAGEVSFAVQSITTPTGHIEQYLKVSYKTVRAWKEETVQLIPELTLLGILQSLIEGDDEAASRLHPAQMAFFSPRVFWNLARYVHVLLKSTDSLPSRLFCTRVPIVAPCVVF
jgi:hypothetical protein